MSFPFSTTKRLFHHEAFLFCAAPASRLQTPAAAATLALLAGCANGFDPVKIVIAPVTELLNQIDNAKQANNTEQNTEQAQDQGQKDAPPPVQTTAKPATVAKPAAQVAAAKPAPAKPAPAKPAPKLVKDVGFFGNFEIGAGFGAQKASGVRGVVTGINDGENPNRLKAGRKVQTLDGEEYTLGFLGEREGKYRCVSSDKPHHRIKVTSPVFVKFSEEVEIQGPYLAACNTATAKHHLPLELLPGDYEIYVSGYENKGNYTLILTEVARPYSVGQTITASPGFKQGQATTLVLTPDYRNSPLARSVELHVTAPMLLKIDVSDDEDYGYRLDEYSLGSYKSFSPRRSAVFDEARKSVGVKVGEKPYYFEPGQYKLFRESSEAPYRTKYKHPGLATFTVRELTDYQAKSIVLDKNFTATRINGFYADDHKKAFEINKEGQLGEQLLTACSYKSEKFLFDARGVHKLIVTLPQLVRIEYKLGKWGSGIEPMSYYILRQVKGGQEIFCSSSDGIYSRPMSVFLKPGEYELYQLKRAKDSYDGRSFFYILDISSSNKQE